MDRRAVLGGMVLAAIGVGSAPAPAGAAGTAGDVAPERPVIEWGLVGGFLPSGFAALRPPRLAIYPYGLAVADAERQIRLSPTELRALVRHAVAVLRNPANGRHRPGAPIIADVPATLLQVRRPAGGRYAIEAEGLEELRQYRAYPRPLYGLLDDLAAVRNRALTKGRPFRPAAVRLVAVSADGTAAATPWPAGVPVPSVSASGGYGTADLYGVAARAVVHGMPRRDPWAWPVYRTPRGRFLSAAWRYLLPGEPMPR